MVDGLWLNYPWPNMENYERSDRVKVQPKKIQEAKQLSQDGEE